MDFTDEQKLRMAVHVYNKYTEALRLLVEVDQYFVDPDYEGWETIAERINNFLGKDSKEND